MANDRIYKYYVYIAGIQISFVSCGVSSRYGSIAAAVIEIPYSPYIVHMHEQTKVQIWEQIISNDKAWEPTLEFDGIVVGIVRAKNVQGNVSARLTCSSDGIVWNRRKQYDFYLSNITEVDTRHTGDTISMRANGSITNFFADVLQNNRFDAGCAAASVLTSFSKGRYEEDADNKDNIYATYYEYIYNGKKFFRYLGEDQTNTVDLTPPYYNKFLNTYKLANKLYGVSTSVNVQKYFQQDRFIKLVTNDVQDLLGENTFWSIATQVLGYGYYSVYDIPNPTFIEGAGSPNSAAGKNINTFAKSVQVSDEASTDNESRQSELSEQNSDVLPFPNITTPLNPKEFTKTKIELERQFHGLAEFILKPISVLGLPLKCNVIWPEQIVSDSIFYDFINSPTRVITTEHLLPGVTDNVVLTTRKAVGPVVSQEGFFKSFTAKTQKIRTADSNSDYEKEYGINYHQIDISYAFENTLLSSKVDSDDPPTDAEIDQLGVKMNNFLNYEFSQRYFSSRNYQAQVAPDVNVVAGLPTILLDKRGEHVIAFVTGVEKSFSATGSKSVSVSIAYPRFYYEDIGALGNVVDPSSIEPQAAAELSLLFGSTPLVAPSDLSSLPKVIEQTFQSYKQLSDDKKEETRVNYLRKVCTYAQFIKLYLNTTPSQKTTMPTSYLEDIFASTETADLLSCHRFRVYNAITGGVELYDTDATVLSNQEIIQKHIDWTSQAQII
jgi:hypothetical protein